MKKRLSILLAICLVVSMIPAMAVTAHAGTAASGRCSSEVAWTLSDDETLTFSGSGTIPSIFNWENQLTLDQLMRVARIVIDEGVTEIASGAFNRFGSCTSLTIPASLTSIPGSLFQCETMREYIVSPGNSHYCNDGYGVLYNKEMTFLRAYPTAGPASYTVPEGVTVVSGFSSCRKLTSLTLPDSLEQIAASAFSGCTGLTEINIPENVWGIYDQAFANCSSLKTIRFKGSAPDSMANRAFLNVTASAYYPKSDPSWTEENLLDYGGTLTWIPYDPAEIPSVSVPLYLTCTESGDDLILSLVAGAGFDLCGFTGTISYDRESFLYQSGAAGIKSLEYLENSNTFPVKFAGDVDKNVRVSKGDTVFSWRFSRSSGFVSGKACSFEISLDEFYYLEGSAPNVKIRDISVATPFSFEYPERLWGRTRTETAVAISQAAFPDGTENVILASGDNYPDALAGGPLAYALDAPILLVCRSKPDQATLDEIDRLGAKNVYILGGTGVISEGVEDTMRAKGLEVERLAGAGRFETAVKIAERLHEQVHSQTEVFVVFYNNYPDALAVSNVAALRTAPILYIQGSGVLDQATEDYLKELTEKKPLRNIYILAGPAVIDSRAETSLGKYGAVTRIYGHDRYETCTRINESFALNLYGDALCLACGTNYPDALAGSVFAAKLHAPLMLAGKALTDGQKTYVKNKFPASIYAFGGTGALSDKVLNEVKLALY